MKLSRFLRAVNKNAYWEPLKQTEKQIDEGHGRNIMAGLVLAGFATVVYRYRRNKDIPVKKVEP